MGIPRIRWIPYFFVWIALTGLQFYTFSSLATEPATMMGVVLLLQILKIPLAIGRLNDLGLPPDEALLAIIPLGNFVLWSKLNRRTPSDEERDRLRTRWTRKTQSFGAFGFGLAAVFRYAVLTVPLAIAGATLDIAVEDQLLKQLTTDALSDGTRTLIRQGALAVFGFLALYTLLQIFKRHTASRASWLPSFLVLPSLLIALALAIPGMVAGNPAAMGASPGMMQIMAVSTAWMLAYSCYMGAAFAILWVLVAQARQDARSLPWGEAFRKTRAAWTRVATPHGTKVMAVWLGLQVVAPGIYYALMYAFVVPIALLEPDAAPLQRSSQLTKGLRKTIFQVLALSFLGGLSGGVLAALPIEALLHTDRPLAETLQVVLSGMGTQQMIGPAGLTSLSTSTIAVAEAVRWLFNGAAQVALVKLYWDARSDRSAVAEAS